MRQPESTRTAEGIEDAEDLRELEDMRKCPLAFTKLEDFPAEASNTADLPE